MTLNMNFDLDIADPINHFINPIKEHKVLLHDAHKTVTVGHIRRVYDKLLKQALYTNHHANF